MPFKINVINPEYKRNVTLQQPHHYLCPGLSCQIPHKELSTLTRVLPFKALGRPVPRHPREGPVHTVLLFRFVWLVSHKLDGPLQRDFKVKWASIRSSKERGKKPKPSTTKRSRQQYVNCCCTVGITAMLFNCNMHLVEQYWKEFVYVLIGQKAFAIKAEKRFIILSRVERANMCLPCI